VFWPGPVFPSSFLIPLNLNKRVNTINEYKIKKAKKHIFQDGNKNKLKTKYQKADIHLRQISSWYGWNTEKDKRYGK